MATHPQLQTGHRVDFVFLMQQLSFGTRLGSPGCLVGSNTRRHGECFPPAPGRWIISKLCFLFSTLGLCHRYWHLLRWRWCRSSQISHTTLALEMNSFHVCGLLDHLGWQCYMLYCKSHSTVGRESRHLMDFSCSLPSTGIWNFWALWVCPVCSVFPGRVLSHTFSSRLSLLLQC